MCAGEGSRMIFRGSDFCASSRETKKPKDAFVAHGADVNAYDGLLISAVAQAWLLHRREPEIHVRPLAQLPRVCFRPVD